MSKSFSKAELQNLKEKSIFKSPKINDEKFYWFSPFI